MLRYKALTSSSFMIFIHVQLSILPWLPINVNIYLTHLPVLQCVRLERIQTFLFSAS